MPQCEQEKAIINELRPGAWTGKSSHYRTVAGRRKQAAEMGANQRESGYHGEAVGTCLNTGPAEEAMQPHCLSLVLLDSIFAVVKLPFTPLKRPRRQSVTLPALVLAMMVGCATQRTNPPNPEAVAVNVIEGVGGRAIGDASQTASPVVEVDLAETQDTDAALKELKALRSLRELNLYKSQVTDAGVSELRLLPTLRILHLGDTNTTDAGFKELANLKGLEVLMLNRTRLTDMGLKELKGLTNLRALGVMGTQVTDAGLKELSGMTGLQTLYLSRTQVKGEGLKELNGLKGLQELWLQGMQVTDSAVNDLKAELPNLQVIR